MIGKLWIPKASSIRQWKPPRFATSTSRFSNKIEPSKSDSNDSEASLSHDVEKGAMSRRLSDLTEQSKLDTARPPRIEDKIQDGGFSEELKVKLLDKIKSAEFKNENASAVGYADLSVAAGKQAREIALSQPWMGQEASEDAVLRMLVDTHKPLKGVRMTPTSRSSSLPLNLRPARKKLTQSERIMSARDRVNTYEITKKPEAQMTEREREEMRKIFRERFQAGARPMPGTVQGLTALANEKIEEAMSRGLFKNLPKGKPLEQNSSPYVDTTEFILNRLIQRQEIVPPWIEKQQELQKEVSMFRNRLRGEWKRHVVRVIASWGGGGEEWVRRAQEFALAEKKWNPDPRLALEEETSVLSKNWKMDGQTVKIGEDISTVTSEPKSSEPLVVKALSEPAQKVEAVEVIATITIPAEATQTPITVQGNEQSPPNTPALPSEDSASPASITPTNIRPFRDLTWQKAELAYHNLNITNLNNLTRSYNLIAPKLAQKPYYNLERELLRIFREVAPTIAAELHERATNPNYGKKPVNSSTLRRGESGLIGNLAHGFGDKVIYEERKEKAYGFKQLWKDLFAKA